MIVKRVAIYSGFAVFAAYLAIYLSSGQSQQAAKVTSKTMDTSVIGFEVSSSRTDETGTANDRLTNQMLNMEKSILALADVTTAIRSELDAMKSTQSVLNRVSTDEQARSTAQAGVALAATNETHEAMQAREKARSQREFTQLSERVSAEAADPSWSLSAPKEIQTKLSGEQFPGSNIVSVTCRATACLADVAHNDEKAMSVFMSAFPMALAWNGSDGRIEVDREGGRLISRMVISRAGTSLPDVH